MKNRWLLFFLLTFLSCFRAFTQTDQLTSSEFLEQRMEYFAEQRDAEDTDYSDMYETFEDLALHPVNLNAASRKQLESTYLFTEVQLNALFKHIKTYGPLVSIEELQTIDGFDAETIGRIAPFVTVHVEHRASSPVINKPIRHHVLLRYRRLLEKQKGYGKPAAYRGSPVQLYSNYRFRPNDRIKIGITAEKDPGEEFFKGSQSAGFDFYSAYISMRGRRPSNQWVIGDFHAMFGQGLTAWSGGGFGKSPEVLQIKRVAPELKASASANEQQFLRGIGAIIRLHRQWKTTFFFSGNAVDAGLEYDTLSREWKITSQPQSGYHRLGSELEKKDRALRFTSGERLEYQRRNFTTALSFLASGIQPVKQAVLSFPSTISQEVKTGIDLDYRFRNSAVFGEISSDKNGSKAWLAGLLIAVDQQLSCGFLHRRLDPDFQDHFSNAVTENSRSQNEQGTYFSADAHPSKNLQLQAYFDFFRFPWLRYQVDAPSQGSEYLVQAQYSIRKKWTFTWRIKQQRKEKNSGNEQAGIAGIVNENTFSNRCELVYQVLPSIQLKSRLESKAYRLGNSGTEEGWLLFQDVKYKKAGRPFSFVFRHAMFDTPSYNSRIYAYENDVLYAFSIPAYYGRGNKFYLLMKYRVGRLLSLWLRYAHTHFSDRSSIGSGHERIEGAEKSELKVQLRLSW